HFHRFDGFCTLASEGRAETYFYFHEQYLECSLSLCSPRIRSFQKQCDIYTNECFASHFDSKLYAHISGKVKWRELEQYIEPKFALGTKFACTCHSIYTCSELCGVGCYCKIGLNRYF